MILIILYFHRWAIAKYGNITKLRKEKQWVPEVILVWEFLLFCGKAFLRKT
jgi:hypothetical protein